MNSTATPRVAERPTWSNRRSTSCADSDAVGSSMISTRASREIALAISTACCAATASVFAGARGSTSMSSERRIAVGLVVHPPPAHDAAAVAVADEDVLGDAEVGEDHRLLVDGDDPAAWASADEPSSTGSPSMRITPSSGW